MRFPRLVALLVAALLPAAGCARFGEPQHNVILIVIDTTRADALGCYGSDRGLTPNLDRLAQEAVRFDHAIAHAPWTLPSMASLLTSTHPTTHGAVGKMLQMNRFAAIRGSLATAAEAFDAAGFTTHAIVNALFLHRELGLDRGFDGYDLDGATNYRVRSARASVERAIRQLKRHRGQRNFLLLHVFDPHLRYDPPEPWKSELAGDYTGPLVDPHERDRFTSMVVNFGSPTTDEQRRYLENLYSAEIAAVDAAFGDLFDALKRMGMYERSTIAVTADHGEEFWDHGGFEHGHSLYDELIRVPLIVKPGRDPRDGAGPPPPRVVSETVRQIDILPTLLELAGVPVPPTFEGQSLAAAFADPPGEIEPRAVFVEEPSLSRRIRFGDHGEREIIDSELIGLRRDGWQLIVNLDDGAMELYHVATDPGEQRDLAGEEPDRAARMRDEALAFSESLLVRASEMVPTRYFDMHQAFWNELIALGYVSSVPAVPEVDGRTKLDKVRALLARSGQAAGAP